MISFNSFVKESICVKLDLHADTSGAGSNLFVIHDHEHYRDISD